MSVWGYNSASHGTPAVGTASALILAANPERRYALIQNGGTANVFLGLGAAAVLNKGIKLEVGDSYEMARGLGNVFSGAINAVGPIADGLVLTTDGE